MRPCRRPRPFQSGGAASATRSSSASAALMAIAEVGSIYSASSARTKAKRLLQKRRRRRKPPSIARRFPRSGPPRRGRRDLGSSRSAANRPGAVPGPSSSTAIPSHRRVAAAQRRCRDKTFADARHLRAAIRLTSRAAPTIGHAAHARLSAALLLFRLWRRGGRKPAGFHCKEAGRAGSRAEPG